MNKWYAYNIRIIENTTNRSEIRTQFVSNNGTVLPFQKIIDYYNENNYSINTVEQLELYIPHDLGNLNCFLEAENYSKRLDEISKEI